MKVAIFGSFIYSFLYRNELHNNFDIDVLIESGMDSNGLVTNLAMEFRGDFVGAIRDRLDDKWKMEVDDADGYLGEFVQEVVVKTKDGKQSFRIQFVLLDHWKRCSDFDIAGLRCALSSDKKSCSIERLYPEEEIIIPEVITHIKNHQFVVMNRPADKRIKKMSRRQWTQIIKSKQGY